MGDPLFTRTGKIILWWERNETRILKPFAIVGLILLGLWLLSGCATEREFIQKPHLNAVTISVVWFDSEAQIKGCPSGTVACATVGSLQRPYSLMRLVRPQSWDDQERICNAGHELMHSLGGTH